jgi:hypothetical protein
MTDRSIRNRWYCDACPFRPAAWRYAEGRPVADWASFLTSLATRRAMDRLRKRYVSVR